MNPIKHRLFLLKSMFLGLSLAVSPLLTLAQAPAGNVTVSAELNETLDHLTWTGQASIRWETNGRVVYLDPFQVTAGDSADIVLITHAHGDHLSADELKKVVTPRTRIIAAPGCAETLTQNGFTLFREAKIGDTFDLDGLHITVVPAYTITKATHPRDNHWVGYVISNGSVTIYHPGDTQRIPEMKDIRCDIAFMPLGQKYTMDKVDDAVDAILDIHPKVAIPFHYGMYEGTPDDAVTFKKRLTDKGQPVIILP